MSPRCSPTGRRARPSCCAPACRSTSAPCRKESYGAALLYFTGSKAHNIALRGLANDRDWKLNEYGLFSGKRRIAGATEEEVYEKLGLAYIPPELREDRGEIALAKANKLPQLVTVSDIRGDLHAHSDWTDGTVSIEEMAAGGAGVRLRIHGAD